MFKILKSFSDVRKTVNEIVNEIQTYGQLDWTDSITAVRFSKNEKKESSYGNDSSYGDIYRERPLPKVDSTKFPFSDLQKSLVNNVILRCLCDVHLQSRQSINTKLLSKSVCARCITNFKLVKQEKKGKKREKLKKKCETFI